MDIKNKLVSQLDIKFKGLNKNVLDRIAEKLSKTIKTEDEVATAVAGVTFQNVIDSYTESRVTEAQKTAIRTYEQRYGLKNGVRSQQEPKQEPKDLKEEIKKIGNQNEETPKWLNELTNAIKGISGRLDNLETQKRSQDRGAILSEKLKDLPTALQSPYKHINVSAMSEEDFNSFIYGVGKNVGYFLLLIR